MVKLAGGTKGKEVKKLVSERIRKLTDEFEQRQRDVVYAVQNGSLEDEKEAKRKHDEFCDSLTWEEYVAVLTCCVERIKARQEKEDRS